METNRQKKIAGVIQKDIANILRRAAKDGGLQGLVISVTKVRVTIDLTVARVYLSIFPNTQREALLEGIQSNASSIRHELSQRTRNQLRKVPELTFFIDDSLDYVEDIERELRGEGGDPLKDPDLLGQRKKK